MENLLLVVEASFWIELELWVPWLKVSGRRTLWASKIFKHLFSQPWKASQITITLHQVDKVFTEVVKDMNTAKGKLQLILQAVNSISPVQLHDCTWGLDSFLHQVGNLILLQTNG